MKFRVRVTEAALEDVDEIRRWIEDNGSPVSAGRFVDRLLAGMRRLETSPRRCAKAPEADWFEDLEIRHQVVSGYRVLFTIEGTEVVVLHVRHGRREGAAPDELLDRADP